jgi:hypothetical protein
MKPRIQCVRQACGRVSGSGPIFMINFSRERVG